MHINKDALLAFAEGAKVFINYLTATASDLCKEAKRQTLSAEDVLGALQDLDFAEFIPPVRDALEGALGLAAPTATKALYRRACRTANGVVPPFAAFRRDSKEKSKRKAELNKKRKAEGPEQASLQADPLAAVLEEGLDPDLDVGADLADHQAHGQAAFKAPDAGYAEEALDPVPAIPEALLH